MKTIISKILSYIKEKNLKRKTQQELERLTDRELRDIGINPGDVRRITFVNPYLTVYK